MERAVTDTVGYWISYPLAMRVSSTKVWVYGVRELCGSDRACSESFSVMEWDGQSEAWD